MAPQESGVGERAMGRPEREHMRSPSRRHWPRNRWRREGVPCNARTRTYTWGTFICIRCNAVREVQDTFTKKIVKSYQAGPKVHK